MGATLFRRSTPWCLVPIALTLFSLLSFPLLAIAQSPQLPQPALLPPTSPLCDSSLVPCLSIDDLAAHGQAQLLILPRTAERSTAITIPYGITMGLFGRISGSVSSSTLFWSQSNERLQSQGPVRLSLTALLWPLLPLRTDPLTSSFRLGIAYDHELRIGPFFGTNSLGVVGDLSVVRVISQKSLGPFDLTLSLGALVDPGRRYATGEAAAQIGFHLPFLPSLKLLVEALGRGIPVYVNRERQMELGEDLLRLQGALGVGLSYAPHARVDFGVSALWGTGGISPSVVVFRFAVLSVGKTYEGRAATPLTELGTDLAAAGAEKVKEVVDELLKETYEESPIDPKLDESCFIRDDDGSIMGRFGKRSLDGKFCEKDGAKVPIGQELWRDKSGDKLCKESRHNPRTSQKELYDCVLWRHDKEWQPAHQARLTEQCELRDSDGRLLGQLGTMTAQGSRCRYPVERNNGKYGRYTDFQEQPRDKIFYTDSERSRICETPNLLRCFLASAEGRSSLKMEPEERFARGADRAERDREQSLKQSGEALEDLATGKVKLSTIKEEIADKTRKVAETVSDKEKLKEYAKGRVSGWLKGVEDWSKKRSDDQLDDAGAVTTGAVIDGAIGLGMGATGRVVGELAEGVEGLRQTGKAAKRARQLEKAEEAARARGGVYILRDPRSGEVMRTGRTNDHDRRRSEHKRHPETKSLNYDPVHKLDDKDTRRGLEQLLHDEHQPPLDKIRPISPDNPNHDKYLNAARSYLKNQEKE